MIDAEFTVLFSGFAIRLILFSKLTLIHIVKMTGVKLPLYPVNVLLGYRQDVVDKKDV